MKWAWLALLSVGCAHRPVGLCVTECGMTLAPPAAWKCSDLQAVETAAVKAYATAKDARMHGLCAALRGYTVQVIPVPNWAASDAGGGTRDVCGLTFCELGLIQVGSQAPFHGALVHEFGHVGQNCVPLGPPMDGVYPDDASHANWGRDGLWKIIDSVEKDNP